MSNMSKKAFRKAFYKQIRSAYKWADWMISTGEEEFPQFPPAVQNGCSWAANFATWANAQADKLGIHSDNFRAILLGCYAMSRRQEGGWTTTVYSVDKVGCRKYLKSGCYEFNGSRWIKLY